MLLMEHLPAVRYLARRIHERLPQHVELDDLVSAGVVGLIDAFSKFDHTRKYSSRVMRNSGFVGRFLTRCERWTGVRESCDARAGPSRRRSDR